MRRPFCEDCGIVTQCHSVERLLRGVTIRILNVGVGSIAPTRGSQEQPFDQVGTGMAAASDGLMWKERPGPFRGLDVR